MNTDLLGKGKAMRETVLGNEYVERAMKTADDFNRPFQELLTEYCWGAIWTRPGLSPPMRSMLNLAMLTALNRSHELKLHIRGAVRNGVSCDEIREVLMQAAVYCGIPAGVEAFRCAREVFEEIEREKTSPA